MEELPQGRFRLLSLHSSTIIFFSLFPYLASTCAVGISVMPSPFGIFPSPSLKNSKVFPPCSILCFTKSALSAEIYELFFGLAPSFPRVKSLEQTPGRDLVLFAGFL